MGGGDIWTLGTDILEVIYMDGSRLQALIVYALGISIKFVCCKGWDMMIL